MATHAEALPEELVHSAKVALLPEASKEALQEAWKMWMGEAVAETGAIPPGNAPGQTLWQQRRCAGGVVLGTPMLLLRRRLRLRRRRLGLPAAAPPPSLPFAHRLAPCPPPPPRPSHLPPPRPRAAKPEIRLTLGKGIEDLTCSVEELIDQVVKGCKVGAGGGRDGLCGLACCRLWCCCGGQGVRGCKVR